MSRASTTLVFAVMQDVDGRDKPGHDGQSSSPPGLTRWSMLN